MAQRHDQIKKKSSKIFNEISVVIFKRHGYNNRALNSITSKTFATAQIKSLHLHQELFQILPSWAWVNNREIKISSSEIRYQRTLLRS